MARHSGREIDGGTCGTTGGTTVYQATHAENNCQQFRLQPLGAVKLINANSTKLLAVDKAATADGAGVVLASEGGTNDQHWRFMHGENGYYQIMAEHSKQCLAVGGNAQVDGAPVDQTKCDNSLHEQWRIEPLNDGTLRLVTRDGGKVLDIRDCHMADGALVQQWSWKNNPCQRFRLVAP